MLTNISVFGRIRQKSFHSNEVSDSSANITHNKDDDHHRHKTPNPRYKLKIFFTVMYYIYIFSYIDITAIQHPVSVRLQLLQEFINILLFKVVHCMNDIL